VDNLKIARDEDLQKATAGDERREFDRKKLIVAVSFNGGETTGIANTRDFGIGGFYLATETELLEGTLLFFKLTLGEKEMNLSGVVVYSDPGQGVGVRFHDLPADDEKHIRESLGI
jgi:PilZ domain